MSATILIFPHHCPRTIPLLPVIPSLSTMIVTLQRNHLHELTWREQAHLFRAMFTVMKGDDASASEHAEQMRRIHSIWIRVTEPEPEDAA